MARVEDLEGGTRGFTIAAKDAQASEAEQQHAASLSNSNTRSASSPSEGVNQSTGEAQSNGGKDHLQQTQSGDDKRDGVKSSSLQQRERSGVADGTGMSGGNGGSNSREPTTGSRPGGEGTPSSSKDKDKDSKSASGKGAKKSKKSKTKTSTDNSVSKTAATSDKDKDNDKGKKGKSSGSSGGGGGKSGKHKSSSGPGSPSGASKSGDKKGIAAVKKDGGASATGTRSTTDKFKPDTKDGSRNEGSRTSRSRGRNHSRGRGRSSRDRSRDSRSFSSSRSWSSRSRSYSSSRSRRRDSRSRSDSRSGSRGRDSRTRKSSRDRDRSSRRDRSRDRSRDRKRDRDRSERGEYLEREQRERGKWGGYERHHDGGRRGDRERDRPGGGRGIAGRGVGWNRERSHRDLDLASLAAPKATSPGVPFALEGDGKVEGAKHNASTAKVDKGGAKDGLGEEAANEAGSASNKVANIGNSVLPDRGSKEQHQRAGSKDGGSSSKDNREREEGSNGNGRHRGRGDQDSRGGDSKRADYGDDRHRRHGRDRQNLKQDEDDPPCHGRYRGGDKDGDEQQPDGGHRLSRRDSRGGDSNRNSNYGRHDSQQHRHNSREHSHHHHRPGKAEHNRDYTQHILRPEEDKANDNNNKNDRPNDTHRDNTDTNNGSLHRDREHRSFRAGPGRGGPPHFRGDRDRGWNPGALDRGIRDSERWRPDREPSEAGGAGPIDRWRPDTEGNDPRELGGGRHVYRGIGGGRGGGDDGWEPRGRGMSGPGGRGPAPRGRGLPPMREEGGGRGGGRNGPWNGPPFPGDGYPQNEGGMAPLMRQPQQEEGPGAVNGQEFGGDDRGRSGERGFPAMREKRRRSGSREVGPRVVDRDNVMDGRNYRDRMDNMDGLGSTVVDAVGGAGTGTLGALAGFGHSPAKRLRGDEPPYGGPPAERGAVGDDSDIRRPPVVGPGPGPGPDPGADRRGVELDPRGLEPRGGDSGMQQPGRGFGGLPGRGFGPGGPGRPGVGMQGRGGGRGRNVGGFGRGVHDLPPPEFQRRDGFSGLPGGPDQNRRTAAAAAVGPGPGGGPFVDHLAGRPDRGGPGPGRGGAGGLVGAGGPVPWRNMPIDFQGRGRPGPGPPRGPSGGLLPDPSSHVGGRGSDGAEIGPSSSGPMMDGIGMDRRDRMVGGRGDRAAMEIGRDASMGRRVVEGREGFERGGGGGGEFGDFSGVGNRGPRGPGGRSPPFLDAPPGMGQPQDRNGAGVIGGGVRGGPPGPGPRGSELITGLDRGAVISNNNRIGGGPTGPGGGLDQRNGNAGGIPVQGRGGSRPPPGIWGPRGPPPSGHPAWNDSQFIRELEQRYQQEQQHQQSNGPGGVKGRGQDGRGPSPPSPWTTEGDGLPGGGMRGGARAGPGPPRAFIQGPGVGPPGIHRSPRRGMGPGGEHGRGDVIGPGGGRGEGGRAPSMPGLNGRVSSAEEQGPWGPSREAPWQNGGGRGPGYSPGPGQLPRGLPMWELGPPGGGGEVRMGPDGRVQQRNWDHRGRLPRNDSRDRGWDSTGPGGGVRSQGGGPAGPADGSNIGDRSNYDNSLWRPPGRSRSRSDSRSRGGMGDGRGMGRPGYGHGRGDGWGPPGRGPPGMQMHEVYRGWPPTDHHRHPPGPEFRGQPIGPHGVLAHSGMDPFGLPAESSGVEDDPAFAREGQGDLGGGVGGAHGGTSGPQEDDPTVLAVAANLAPVCVSRRLLSSSAYQRVALARQAGDAVHAGLTFEAEEEDHDNEEQDDAWLEGGGLDMVGSGGVVKEERSGTRDDVLDGMEIDGMLTDLPGTAAASAADSEIAPASTDKPAAEEDDLYDDLYGGLDDDGTIGVDDKMTSSSFSLRRNSNGGGDGDGRRGGGMDSECGGGKSGESREGASGQRRVGKGGRRGNEDVSTRSVMNALKRLEGPIFIPARAEEHALYDLQNLATCGLPSSAKEFAQEMLATLLA